MPVIYVVNVAGFNLAIARKALPARSELHYIGGMTDLLKIAIDAVRQLPVEEQDEIARMLLGLVEQDEAEDIDPTHMADVMAGLDEMKRREFASDEEVADVFHRFEA